MQSWRVSLWIRAVWATGCCPNASCLLSWPHRRHLADNSPNCWRRDSPRKKNHATPLAFIDLFAVAVVVEGCFYFVAVRLLKGQVFSVVVLCFVLSFCMVGEVSRGCNAGFVWCFFWIFIFFILVCYGRISRKPCIFAGESTYLWVGTYQLGYPRGVNVNIILNKCMFG